jgi:hypothetical protein
MATSTLTASNTNLSLNQSSTLPSQQQQATQHQKASNLDTKKALNENNMNNNKPQPPPNKIEISKVPKSTHKAINPKLPHQSTSNLSNKANILPSTTNIIIAPNMPSPIKPQIPIAAKPALIQPATNLVPIAVAPINGVSSSALNAGKSQNSNKSSKNAAKQQHHQQQQQQQQSQEPRTIFLNGNVNLNSLFAAVGQQQTQQILKQPTSGLPGINTLTANTAQPFLHFLPFQQHNGQQSTQQTAPQFIYTQQVQPNAAIAAAAAAAAAAGHQISLPVNGTSQVTTNNTNNKTNNSKTNNQNGHGNNNSSNNSTAGANSANGLANAAQNGSNSTFNSVQHGPNTTMSAPTGQPQVFAATTTADGKLIFQTMPSPFTTSTSHAQNGSTPLNQVSNTSQLDQQMLQQNFFNFLNQKVIQQQQQQNGLLHSSQNSQQILINPFAAVAAAAAVNQNSLQQQLQQKLLMEEQKNQQLTQQIKEKQQQQQQQQHQHSNKKSPTKNGANSSINKSNNSPQVHQNDSNISHFCSLLFFYYLIL